MSKKRQPARPELPPFLLATDKRTTVLRAAATLFLRDGYSGTSMDAVTAEAGVSKATVYAHFASKGALFETLMREGTGTAFSQFPSLVRAGGDPTAELLAFLTPVTEHILGGGLAWYRLIVAEAVRHPQYARLFREVALGRLQQVLERYFEELVREGVLADVEPHRAAEALLTLVLIGPLHDRLLLGPEAADFQERLRFALATVLRAYGR